MSLQAATALYPWYALAGTGRRGGAVAGGNTVSSSDIRAASMKRCLTQPQEREQRTAYEVSARLIRRKGEARNESKSRNE